MKKIICLLLVLILCFANQLPAFAAVNEALLPSGTKAADIEASVDAYVNEHKDTTAAVSVAVFTRDEVVMEKAYGYTDLENKIANDSEAVFEWGSCTKLLTWVSVMQLVEQGKIDLNRDVQAYLPPAFFKNLKYGEPITMLNLMNHNAGWQETVTDLFIKDKKDIKSLGDELKYLEPEQIYKPGEIVAYSNWGAALAGYIVECVSGQSFSDYVKEHIFTPLGMEHTAISADLSDNEWVLNQRMKEKCYSTNNTSLDTSLYYIALYPAGMATGTISDFVKFARAFIPASGSNSPLFQNAETLDTMLSPSSYYGDKETPRNCHGFWTDRFAADVLWHNGGTIGSTSYFAFDKESGTGAVILTNQSDESVYTGGLLPLIFGKHKNTDKVDSTVDISGVYLNSQSCYAGYAKLYGLLNTLELTKEDAGTFTVPGSTVTMTGVSSNTFQLSTGGFIYASSDDQGRTILQMFSSDFFPADKSKLLLEYLLLLLFVLASVYSAVSFIIEAVRWTKKERKPLDGFRMAVNAAVIISFGLCLNIMSTLLLMYSPLFRNIYWKLALCNFMAFLPIAFVPILIIQWRKLDCTVKLKVSLIINAFIGLISSANLLYWLG